MAVRKIEKFHDSIIVVTDEKPKEKFKLDYTNLFGIVAFLGCLMSDKKELYRNSLRKLKVK